ncbi:hypothetical protein INS49_010840 [Diaporthe citri]|uniref:uncharacterized protein n=1 Tax=Diaporthe citri TaxID=83186 RepID=UPI001C807302|nr:uncharacterized protein INS49_010840 [Diaporthe citri]KAG6359788.1 hypothetical protein INS49_010840 [Diaporthe citri]
MQPPKVSDPKRKRGRPPGASKSKGDASSHEAPDHDAEPDPEDARPRKRGRKNEAEGASTEPGPSRNDNGPAQPPKAGRPPKKSQHTAKPDIQRETEEQDRHSNAARPDSRTARLKGKRKTAHQIQPREEEQQLESSEPRRSRRVPGGSSSEAPGAEQPAYPQEISTERAPKRAGGASSGASKDKRKALAGKEKATASQTSPKEDEQSASAPRRSGRDRKIREPDNVPSGSRQNNQQDAQPTAGPDSGRSRTRANGESQEAASPKAQQNHPAARIGKKRRGRPSLNKEDSESARALQPQQGNRAKAARESSEADKTADESRSVEDSRPKRRGRPRQSDIASQEPEPAQPTRSRGKPRRRSPDPADEQEQEQGQTSTKKKRDKRQPRRREPVAEEEQGEDEDTGSEEDEQEFPFRYLKESTKKIPRCVISEKWSALDGPSISAVGTFLADAQRPVLLRLQNTSRRREHASAALSGISRRLHTKLVRGLPFPAPTAGPARRAASGSHEDEFDFERAMNAAQGLENTLNTLLHSVSLLEREIKKEEDALARDYDTLHKLEANARSEAKGWREKAKREHVLASGIRRKDEGVDYLDEGERLELVARPEDAVAGGLFKDLDDEELVALSKQIGSHMESMQGNLHQIGGVVPAISRSKAALQQVMQKHLDEEEYDKVVLG